MSHDHFTTKMLEAQNWLAEELRKTRRETHEASLRVYLSRKESVERAMRSTTDPKVRAKQKKNLARIEYNIGQIVKELLA